MWQTSGLESTTHPALIQPNPVTNISLLFRWFQRIPMRRIVMVFALFCIMVSGCGSFGAAAPDVGVLESELNTRLELVVPDGWNSYTTDDEIGMVINNISDEPILFDHYFGARLFFLQDNQWVETENAMTFMNMDAILLEPNAELDFHKKHPAVVHPALPDLGKKYTLRIYLIGNVCKDGQPTSTKTAVYIDLDLKPQK